MKSLLTRSSKNLILISVENKINKVDNGSNNNIIEKLAKVKQIYQICSNYLSTSPNIENN